MKKILIIMLLVCMAMSSACAENFSIRNGITFHDTMDDVLKKETLEIKEVDREGKKITTVSASVSGIPRSYIEYSFGEDGLLCEISYDFPGELDKTLADSRYETINDGLKRKYGEPLGYSGGTTYILTKGAIESAYQTVAVFQLLNRYGDVRDYDEWTMRFDDCNVKIEQVEYYMGGSYDKIVYSNKLSYAKYTDVEVEEARNQKHENQNAVDNDL